MNTHVIPAWQLFGEETLFPDLLHIERISDRAAGLDWIIAPHRHLQLHQLFLLTAGQAQISVEGTVLTPDLPVAISIPPGQVHGFRFSAQTQGSVLTLPVELFPDLFGAGAETSVALSEAFLTPIGPVIMAKTDDIHRLHAGAGPFRKTQLQAGVAQILATLLTAQAHRLGARRMHPKFIEFAALIQSSLRQQMSIAACADRLALSSRHLNRLCQAATGQSASAYAEAQRLREACRLLAYTRMSVQAVGYGLGYDDPAYFSRAFARAIGLSPSAYRRRF